MPCNVSVRGAFQLTPSVGRATSKLGGAALAVIISIHALHGEGDVRALMDSYGLELFQSTPSARRATEGDHGRDPRHRHFNPRPPRGERPDARRHPAVKRGDFNPRPPRGGRRRRARQCRCIYKFQSTPSARRATWARTSSRFRFDDFNPRPPRGGRPEMPASRRVGVKFQSTPSARRATCKMPGRWRPRPDFNPRPPRGGRPIDWHFPEPCFVISIHALREEGDARVGHTACEVVVISIHALREEGDHQPHRLRAGTGGISIHALREEGDTVTAALGDLVVISIHALREEGDPGCTTRPYVLELFQSTPSARRATVTRRVPLTLTLYFNPRPPRGGRQQKRRKNPPRLFHYTHLCTI